MVSDRAHTDKTSIHTQIHTYGQSSSLNWSKNDVWECGRNPERKSEKHWEKMHTSRRAEIQFEELWGRHANHFYHCAVWRFKKKRKTIHPYCCVSMSCCLCQGAPNFFFFLIESFFLSTDKYEGLVKANAQLPLCIINNHNVPSLKRYSFGPWVRPAAEIFSKHRWRFFWGKKINKYNIK